MHQTLSANHSRTMFDMCEELVPVPGYVVEKIIRYWTTFCVNMNLAFRYVVNVNVFFSISISQLFPIIFFSDLWEQKPLLIKRHQTEFNEGWFSTKELDDILREVTTRLIIMPYNNLKKSEI